METAEHREPYKSRGSRTDRGAPGGESPPGNSTDDMRRRSAGEWTDWLARDRTYSSQPYEQLSSVLAAAGQRYAAAYVQFAGRDRERKEDCASWSSPRGCIWLYFLRYADGYGIGIYTFTVLIWVAIFVALGTVVLRFSERARRRSLPWQMFASLHRLLPIAKLSKEFEDFFDNPNSDDPRNLKQWQMFYFAIHAIVGWALGLVLLAAMSGLTQKG